MTENEQMTWAQALAQLEEAPPMEQEIRTRYCEIIRAEIVRLTDLVARPRRPSLPPIENAAANTKRVLREALVWFRGTSLSIRVQPEDRPWAEEFHTSLSSKPGIITLRMIADDPTPEEVAQSFEGIARGSSVRFRVGIASEPRAGDIQIPGCVARSIGGFDGVSPIITFGVADRSQIVIVESRREEPKREEVEPKLIEIAPGTFVEPNPARAWKAEVKVTTIAEGKFCPHDNVEVMFVEKRGPIARCAACGEMLETKLAGDPSLIPEGYVEVELNDASMTAIAATRKKLEALAFLPSLRGQEQEEALSIGEGGTRFFVPRRIAQSAERLGLVKSVRWRLP